MLSRRRIAPVGLLLLLWSTAPPGAAPGRAATDAPTPWNLPLPNHRDQIDVLGHWPNGQSYTAFPLGDLLYVGCGASLVVLDASDPTELVPLGRFALPGTALSIEVVERSSGAGSGRIAYLNALPFGIVAVDVTDPARMRALDLFPIRQRIWRLYPAGSLLFCAAGSAGLVVLDVGDPTRIREVSRWTVEESSLVDLVVRDGLAYLAYNRTGLVVLDVGDPTVPFEAKRIASPSDLALSRSLCFVGEHLLTCDTQGDVLSWDLSDPRSPELVNVLAIGGRLEEITSDGNRAFLAANGVYELDVTDPADPILVWQSPDNLATRSQELRGNLLSRVRYGGPGRSLRVEMLDVSIPGAGVLLSTFADGGLLEDAAGHGNWLISVGHHDGLRILSAGDPGAINTVGRLAIATPYDVLVLGDVAWVGHLFGLTGVDLSDPTRPEAIGQLPSGRIANMSARADTLVAVGPLSIGADLRIIDIGRPDQPSMIGELALPGVGLDVAWRGRYAYVAGQSLPYTGAGHLQVVDLEAPAAPQLRQEFPLPRTGRSVAAFASLLYVACADSTVHVYDLADPEQPALARVLQTFRDVRGIHIDGDRLYLLTAIGIDAMSLAEPLHPREVASFETGSLVTRLDVSGPLLVAAAYETGVWLLRDLSRLAPPPHPSRLAFRLAPNPFRLQTTVALEVPSGGRHRVRLHDARGRLVRELYDGELSAGTHGLVWDGRDRQGRPSPAGVYLVRVEGPAGGGARSVVLLR